MFAKLFSRYFVNPRQSEKIYWVLNSQFLQIFSKNKQCFKISRNSWIAASCHPQNCLNVWKVSFWEKKSKDGKKVFLILVRSHRGIINNTDIFGIFGLADNS